MTLHAVLALLVIPTLAVAQETQREAPRQMAPNGSIAVGATRVLEDGESSTRASIFWYASDRLVPGLTTSWGQTDNFEPELRWFPGGRVAPVFLSTSFIYKNRGSNRFGGSVALGVMYPSYGRVTATFSLGWESVFAAGPPDGPHWFRLQGGMAVSFPFASAQ